MTTEEKQALQAARMALAEQHRKEMQYLLFLSAGIKDDLTAEAQQRVKTLYNQKLDEAKGRGKPDPKR